MDKLYDELQHFGEKELRMLLYNALNTIELYRKVGDMEEKRAAEQFVTILQKHVDAVRSHQVQEDAQQGYVQLLFGLSDAGSLKVMLSKIGKRQECRVLAFNDLFSVGPLADLDTVSGQQQRLLWMMEYDRAYMYAQHSNRDNQLVHMVNSLRSIPENKTIVIWCADNAHDQTGLRFALYLLRERVQPIHVVNVSELQLAAGLHTKVRAPYALGLFEQEDLEELVRSSYQGIPLEPSLRRRYEEEWHMLSRQDRMLRLWDGGSVRGADLSALDEEIVKSINDLEHEQDENGYIKAGKVVGKVLDTTQQLVGDGFIAYRIWTLVDQGVLTFRGVPGGLHQFSVKMLK